MGRAYYAVPTGPETERLVHVLKTSVGVMVIAIRAPNPGERGTWVGMTETVELAVRMTLEGWEGDEGPGFRRDHTDPGWVHPRQGDDTFAITILAAFEIGKQPAPEPCSEAMPDDRETQACARCWFPVEDHKVPRLERTEIAVVEFRNGDLGYRVTSEGKDIGRELAVHVGGSSPDRLMIRKGDRVAISYFDGEDTARLVEVLS